MGEQPPAPVEPPRIAFDASVHDFGEVEQGAPMEHAFSFRNAGGSDLSVDKLRSGCGCEATLDVDRLVEAGAAARLRVRCETGTAFGKQRRTVSVYTNDPVTPVSVVRLVGTVRADATLVPSTFYVGRVHRGARVQRDGLVRWPAPAGPMPVVADAEAPFRVEMATPAAGSDRCSFTLVMKDDAPIGDITGRLHLKGVATRSPRSVPVIGEVVPDVSIAPARIELAAAPADGSRSVLVMVENGGPRPVRITGVEWPLGMVSLDTMVAGERYRLALKVEGPIADGATELVVRTDHPEQALLRVPVVQRVP